MSVIAIFHDSSLLQNFFASPAPRECPDVNTTHCGISGTSCISEVSSDLQGYRLVIFPIQSADDRLPTTKDVYRQRNDVLESLKRRGSRALV